ncbi:MAG TPA: MFS transporter [Streptosporangiaceae bacterium]|jgi:MFS family permease
MVLHPRSPCPPRRRPQAGPRSCSWIIQSIAGRFGFLQGLQAIGGAFVTANSGAVIADLYPPKERGRAYGFNAVGWTLGAVLGIVLGGIIVTYVSWRWIFWINVPIGVGALALAMRVLADRGERVSRRLDLAGMITLGLGLFGVLWAMTKLATSPLDATQIGYLAGGLVMLVVFVLVERHQRAPMLDLSLFSIPTMAPSLLASLFQGLASSFTTAILIASHSISRGLAFAIFVGTTTLHGHLAAAFTTGLHAAFYAMTAFMVVAAVLSAIRGRIGAGRRAG